MKNNINNINNGYLTGVGTLNAADIAVQEEGEGERERGGREREGEGKRGDQNQFTVHVQRHNIFNQLYSVLLPLGVRVLGLGTV